MARVFCPCIIDLGVHCWKSGPLALSHVFSHTTLLSSRKSFLLCVKSLVWPGQTHLCSSCICYKVLSCINYPASLYLTGLCKSSFSLEDFHLSFFPCWIMQVPMHLCLHLRALALAGPAGKRALVRSQLRCGGSLLPDTPWCRRKKCRRKMLAICLWSRHRLGVILMWHLVPQKASECSIQ